MCQTRYVLSMYVPGRTCWKTRARKHALSCSKILSFVHENMRVREEEGGRWVSCFFFFSFFVTNRENVLENKSLVISRVATEALRVLALLYPVRPFFLFSFFLFFNLCVSSLSSILCVFFLFLFPLFFSVAPFFSFSLWRPSRPRSPLSCTSFFSFLFFLFSNLYVFLALLYSARPFVSLFSRNPALHAHTHP